MEVAGTDLAVICPESGDLVYYCPGCGIIHSVPPDQWNWNESVVSPTLSPSVRHYYQRKDGSEHTTCHYFIRDGRIEYCNDSEHDYRGSKVILSPLEDWAYEWGYGVFPCELDG